MPVTFGTVQLVPEPSQPAARPANTAAAPSTEQPPPDPRDTAPVLRKLHDRALRVRAY
jgi:hypothetical protein